MVLRSAGAVFDGGDHFEEGVERQASVAEAGLGGVYRWLCDCHLFLALLSAVSSE